MKPEEARSRIAPGAALVVAGAIVAGVVAGAVFQFNGPAVASVIGITVIVLALLQQRPAPILLGGCAVLGALWLVAVVLVATNWQDAYGWFDCYPACNTAQRFVGPTLVLAPVLAAFWLLFAWVASLGSKRSGQT